MKPVARIAGHAVLIVVCMSALGWIIGEAIVWAAQVGAPTLVP